MPQKKVAEFTNTNSTDKCSDEGEDLADDSEAVSGDVGLQGELLPDEPDTEEPDVALKGDACQQLALAQT